jgi:hypothetical protein
MMDDIKRFRQLAGISEAAYSQTYPTTCMECGTMLEGDRCPTCEPDEICPNCHMDPCECGPNDWCPKCGEHKAECCCEEHDEQLVAEDLATSNDWGHKPDTIDQQSEYEDLESTQFYNPDEKFGKRGDNTLVNEAAQKLKKLTQRYATFLREFENDSGVASPLTSNSRNEFKFDPFAGEEPVTDGSRSPMSTVRQGNNFSRKPKSK